MRLRVRLVFAAMVLSCSLVGCGESKDNKQPKVSGPADPKLQGAQPAGPSGPKGSAPAPGIE